MPDYRSTFQHKPTLPNIQRINILIAIQASMKRSGCISKLKPHLDQSPLISNWYADLSDPKKLLFVNLEPSAIANDVVALVHSSGFDAKLVKELVQPSKPVFKLATYRPLFLVVTYAAGAAAFVQYTNGEWF